MFAESARIFGHRTKGALNFFYQCKDFHKTYAFIAAFAEAATRVRFFKKHFWDERPTSIYPCLGTVQIVYHRGEALCTKREPPTIFLHPRKFLHLGS